MYPYQNYIPQSSIGGKMIANPNEITINDISMDGRVSVFPFMDGSQIITKCWCNNGTIATQVYKPVNTQTPTNAPIFENKPQVSLDDIQRQLDDIATKMSKISELWGEKE